MKFSDLQSKSDEQLVHEELALERTLLTYQLRHRLGKLEDTSLLRKARRDIARAQTLLTRREQAAGLGRGTLRARHAGTFVPAAAPVAQEAGGEFLKGLLDDAGQKD